MMRRVAVLCAVLSVAPTWAWACSEPSSDIRIPRAPSRISQPSCLYSSNCTEYDLRSYKNDVGTYVERLNRYASDAAYAADAAKRFADNAEDYARCESSNAKSAIR